MKIQITDGPEVILLEKEPSREKDIYRQYIDVPEYKWNEYCELVNKLTDTLKYFDKIYFKEQKCPKCEQWFRYNTGDTIYTSGSNGTMICERCFRTDSFADFPKYEPPSDMSSLDPEYQQAHEQFNEMWTGAYQSSSSLEHRLEMIKEEAVNNIKNMTKL